MVTIRTLRADEKLPQHFKTGYELMPVMPDWCWLAEEGDKPVGALLAAPCHGVAYLVRVFTIEGASTEVTVNLILQCFHDCKKRGYHGFLTHICPLREQEGKLMMLTEKWGGFQAPEFQVAIVGPIERGAWKNIPRKRILEMF
jgi:hypothetical protein